MIHQFSNKFEIDQESLIELKLSNLNEGLNVTDLFFIKKKKIKLSGL